MIWRALMVFAVLMLPVCAFAHPARMMSANLSVGADGKFVVRIHFDLMAYLLNDDPVRVSDDAMNGLLDGSSGAIEQSLVDARRRMINSVAVFSGNRKIHADQIDFPTIDHINRWKASGVSPRLPVMQDAILQGVCPVDASKISVKLPEVLGKAVVTIERPGEELYSEPVGAGQATTPLSIHLGRPAVVSPSDPSTFAVLLKYVHSGFIHIIPEGLDHILFVLGLFLLSSKWGDLLWQVTAFTLAHSITLALAMFNIITLPASLVEPIIAMSIAFIAIENICTKNLKPWRPFVVFGFGLIHGLGFASVLRETGLPRGQFIPAVLSFNVGVELGQLAVIGIAFSLVGCFRKQDWFRVRIAIPASILIATVALFWTVQRILA